MRMKHRLLFRWALLARVVHHSCLCPHQLHSHIIHRSQRQCTQVLFQQHQALQCLDMNYSSQTCNLRILRQRITLFLILHPKVCHTQATLTCQQHDIVTVMWFEVVGPELLRVNHQTLCSAWLHQPGHQKFNSPLTNGWRVMAKFKSSTSTVPFPTQFFPLVSQKVFPSFYPVLYLSICF